LTDLTTLLLHFICAAPDSSSQREFQ